MSNQVPEWVHYGDGIGAVIVDYASKGIVFIYDFRSAYIILRSLGYR